MTSFLNAIIPPRANNDYRVGAVALYGFCLLVAMHVFSATVHFLTPDSGKNSIASIIILEGDPNPNPVFYMFASLAGMYEMLIVLLFFLVLCRYRNLIPAMLALLLIWKLFGLLLTTMHPLTPEYFEQTPPALLIRVPEFIILFGLSFLSVRKTMQGGES